MPIDRAGLAEFLRHRRGALQPEDVGLPRGVRRRTEGLRREEIASLAHMSTDYYARLERERGPHPSREMILSIAQALHLAREERDHLLRLAGHQPAPRGGSEEYVSPGMLRVFDRLADTPAEIVTELGETLRQSPLGSALTGDTTRFRGPSRSIGYRWFADPESRRLYAEEDHPFLSRLWVSGLRAVVALRGPDSRAAHLAGLLLDESEEFRTLWATHEIGLRPPGYKRFEHPELGRMELACQTLVDPNDSHSLLVYTARPGSESAEKLALLAVIGAQQPISAD